MVPLGAETADIAGVDLVPHMLGLKDLCLSLTADLASHDPQYNEV